MCPYCFESVGHFYRHLFRKHSDEEAIKVLMKMPVKSKERRNAIVALRRKGNFILKQQKNELLPVRKSRNFKEMKEDYFPCVHCLGYFKRTYLWRHRKICESKVDKCVSSKKTQHLSEAQTFLATTGFLGNYLNKSILKRDVFNIMRPDDISLVAKQDALICVYGESYLNKHKRKQMNVVVSNLMREMARLKIAIQKSTTIVSFMDILKPKMYSSIIAATKVISGYNPEHKTFKASSLALKLGTKLKFICDIAKKVVITSDPLFPKLNSKERYLKIKEIEQIREMIESHWCNDISSLANKVLNEKKVLKLQFLPLTEDVQKFNMYISFMADSAYEKLKFNENMLFNYRLLSECTLCLVLLFNRKRIGEVQYLEIDAYERDYSSINQEESLNLLSAFEKSMSATLKRIIVFGKGSKPVPILFTRKMQKYIDLLLVTRRSSNIIPPTNKYVFAYPGSEDRWINGSAVIRKMAQKCGAKQPELLTSTKFRKQIATILQVMNFEKDEMEQIAKFMGHTEKTHLEFYR